MKIKENLSKFLKNEISLEELLQGDVRNLIAHSLQTFIESSEDSDDDQSDLENEEKEFLCAFAQQILTQMNEYDLQTKKEQEDLYKYERLLLAQMGKKNAHDLLNKSINVPKKYQKKFNSLLQKYQEDLQKKNNYNAKFFELAKKTPKLDLLKQKDSNGKKNNSKKWRYKLYKLLRINPKDRYVKKLKGRFIFLITTSIIMASFTTILAFSALNGSLGFTIATLPATIGISAVIFVVSWIVLYTAFSFLSNFFSNSFNKGLGQMFDKPNSMHFLKSMHHVYKPRMEKHFLPWIEAVSQNKFDITNDKFTIYDNEVNIAMTQCDSLFFKKIAIALHCMYDNKKYYGSSYLTPFLQITPFLIGQLKEIACCLEKLENSSLLTMAEISLYKTKLLEISSLLMHALKNSPSNTRHVFCDGADFIKIKKSSEEKVGFDYDEKNGGYWMNNLIYFLTYTMSMTAAPSVENKIKSINKYKDFFVSDLQDVNVDSIVNLTMDKN